VEELGENHLLYVEAGQGRRLTVREPGDARHEAGQEVRLDLAPEFCHLFRNSGEALPRLTDPRNTASSSSNLASTVA
jgi:multiple sugar transport system ATP-binding protein